MNELQKRRGTITINLKTIRDANENTLREIFSNFFPFATEPSHTPDMYGSVKYYGVSPHFDIVPDGEVFPEYKVMMQDDEGLLEFKQMVQVYKPE